MKQTSAFEQNIIALIWDFDKTLITGYMQEPLFRRYGVDAARFWKEVRNLKKYYAEQGVRINDDSIYLNHVLTYVQNGTFKGLNNKLLEELGAELEFYPGIPSFFQMIKQIVEENNDYQQYDIKLEHYIVSTGFAAMIRGSQVAPYIEDYWGCEFIETPAPAGYLEGVKADSAASEISQVAIALDNTSKTRAIFEINKGANVSGHIDVNSRMELHDRRVPFENMVYIADGPSDVPAFSILNRFGGTTYAVYPAGNREAFRQVDSLCRDGRIQMFGEADYRENSHTSLWIREHVTQIAESIIAKKEAAIRSSVGSPPRHL